jgi:hypothetical protein
MDIEFWNGACSFFFVKNEDLGTKHMGLCSIDGDHENIWMSPVGGGI